MIGDSFCHSRSHEIFAKEACMTKKLCQCVVRQCTHILNGCVEDPQAMNVSTGEAKYRHGDVSLPTYSSTRGSSKVEVVHSVTDQGMYTFNNNRQVVFDARVHWKLTNYNCERLRAMGKDALPDNVAPSEVDDSFLVPSTTLRFGFDYCHHVMKRVEERIHNTLM